MGDDSRGQPTIQQCNNLVQHAKDREPHTLRGAPEAENPEVMHRSQQCKIFKVFKLRSAEA